MVYVSIYLGQFVILVPAPSPPSSDFHPGQVPRNGDNDGFKKQRRWLVLYILLDYRMKGTTVYKITQRTEYTATKTGQLHTSPVKSALEGSKSPL